MRVLKEREKLLRGDSNLSNRSWYGVVERNSGGRQHDSHKIVDECGEKEGVV